jgi:GntR family transcriptional regulator/MocR family aminotransferase
VVHIYDQRRHLFSDLLRQHFGAEIEFDVPDGGLAFWVRFPTSTKVEGLVAAAAANRVKILPGSICSTSDGTSFGLRLGFGSLNDREIADAVARLARCWRSLNN